MKKATLKQISQMAGVSLTTVHRALNGKGGCSREVEEKILRIAREQGYTTNIMAQSLRKAPINIAFIFPFRDNGGRFFIDRILDGYLEYRRETEAYNILFQEFLLRSNDHKKEEYADMCYPELEGILHQILQKQPVHCDGLVIYGFSVTNRAEALLKKISENGTRVVVMERELESLLDYSVVKANEIIAGDMAGEILSRDIRATGTVLIIEQQVVGGDQNGSNCEEFLRRERPELQVVRVPVVMNVDESDTIAREMEKNPDLVGLYVTCGRHTNSALKAIEKLGRKPQSFIGSEVFDESYRALQERRVDALIDKRPEKIGYMALRVLLEGLFKVKELPVVHRVTPRIVLRSNCHAYYVKKGVRYDEDEYNDE